MKKRKEKVGGMALFNGLMLRNKKREAVGKVDSNGDIQVTIKNNYSKINDDTFTIYDVPIIRGIISMKNMISSSVPYVIKSSQDVLNKTTKEEVEIEKFEIVTAYIIAITVILFLLAAIPNYISNFLAINIRNISQAIMQTVAFVIYLLMLAKFNSLKTLFEYHGAEHKVANAYEKLDRCDITVENVKKESRFHIRCGGNFVVYLFLLILAITFVIPSNNLIFKTIIQVFLLPFLAGFSYELVMGTNYLPNFLKFLAYPAMSIQFITTKEPTDDKIQLAIYTLFGCLDGDKEIKVNEFFKSYLQDNKDLKDKFDKKDGLVLLSSIKKINIDELYLKQDCIFLNFNERIKLTQGLNKLYKHNIPLCYVTGEVNFYREKYFVNNKVLIPRPDSEILVDTAIKYIENEELKTMIDMCTGSGCIGISIAKNSSLKHTMLVDISKEALEVANKNIYQNEANLKCCTYTSDLFSNFTKDLKYDIIVSNPPYIPTSDIQKLDKSVKDNEPLIALDGGEDGMIFYKKILDQATNFLNDNGLIIFEIGYDELKKITDIISKYDNYKIIESIKDYGGNDRVIVCRFLNK